MGSYTKVAVGGVVVLLAGMSGLLLGGLGGRPAADQVLPDPWPAGTALSLQRVEQPHGTDARRPAFSPKGAMVAFEAWRGDSPQVLVSLIGRSGPTDRPLPVVLKEQAPDVPVSQPVWHPSPGLFVTGGAQPRLRHLKPAPGAQAGELLKPELAPGPQSNAQVCASGMTLLWLGEDGIYRWERGKDDVPMQLLAGRDLHGLAVGSRCDGVLTQRGDEVLLVPVAGGEAEVLSAQGRGAVFVGNEPLWLSPDGDAWQLHLGRAGEVIASQVALPPSEQVGVAEDGDWVLWSRPGASGRVWALHLPDREEHVLSTGLQTVGDLDLAQGFHQTWLALSGRAPGSAHDGVYVVQVTDVLGPPASDLP